MADILERIADAVYRGDIKEVEILANEVIASNIDPLAAIQQGGVRGLERLGDAFGRLEVFLPELMLGGEAMKLLIAKLTPHFKDSQIGYIGKVVIGCPKGDLHDIGKNLVATQLSINGFDVTDLGIDVNTNTFLDKAAAVNADIIAISSLLTTTAYYQKHVIDRLKAEGIRDRYKVIVGGGPITPAWASEIGADGYARNAVKAVNLCKTLLEGQGEEVLIFE